MDKKITWQNALFWLIALAYLGYLALRLMRIPMTQDEVATCYNHVPRAVWDILTYAKDAVPNNHILNTLCIKLVTGLFGMDPVTARIPVFLIGGVFYTLSAFALARRIGPNDFLKILSLVVLLGNPFMSEFFALARGYGMAIGLQMTAMYFSWQFVGNRRSGHLAMAVLTAGLAVWASFTVLYFYLPWALLMGLYILDRSKNSDQWKGQLAILVTGAVLLALVCFLPVSRMHSDDQLHFWGTTGFVQETAFPLIRSSILSHPYFDQYTLEGLFGLIAGFTLVSCLLAIWCWYKNKWKPGEDVWFFAAFLFAGTITTNLLIVHILDIPFLNPRTAIFYYPPFAMLLVGVGIALWEKYGKRAYWFLIPLGLFTMVNFDNNRNLKQSYEWPYDRGTIKILDFIKAAYVSENRTEPFTLDCHWLHQNSLHFHLEFDPAGYASYIRMPNHYHGNEPPRADTDFYYTENWDEIVQIADRYTPVLNIEYDRFVLMRRRAPEFEIR
ncbi:MAG: hypothetical protein H6574_00615 [Lewinellaceae bacterium]|nr:hypothetical protein [Saprospiraceae bacterium]MCB9329558.1 hypothetical protein [Lewinellaceae bacterium]